MNLLIEEEQIGRCGLSSASVVKKSAGLYEVIGKSGNNAGFIQRLSRGWILQMHGQPPCIYATYRAGAKPDAIKEAERY